MVGTSSAAFRRCIFIVNYNVDVDNRLERPAAGALIVGHPAGRPGGRDGQGTALAAA
jgi:hypothetical protein